MRSFRSPTRPVWSSSAARLSEEFGVEIVSTGGTAKALADAGVKVRPIDDLTGFPEMMDGRVKTLHPRVHGGLLARRDVPAHMAAAEEHGIGMIDLVCVNLYAFEATIAKRRRDRGRGDREHRHRRPVDAALGRQELRERHRRHRPRLLRLGARRDARQRRRDHARDPQARRDRGLPHHERVRLGDLDVPLGLQGDAVPRGGPLPPR